MVSDSTPSTERTQRFFGFYRHLSDFHRLRQIRERRGPLPFSSNLYAAKLLVSLLNLRIKSEILGCINLRAVSEENLRFRHDPNEEKHAAPAS
jgi:hypothetical protein